MFLKCIKRTFSSQENNNHQLKAFFSFFFPSCISLPLGEDTGNSWLSEVARLDRYLGEAKTRWFVWDPWEGGWEVLTWRKTGRKIGGGVSQDWVGGKRRVCVGFFFVVFSFEGFVHCWMGSEIRRENHRLDAFETLGNSGKELPFPQLVSLPDFWTINSMVIRVITWSTPMDTPQLSGGKSTRDFASARGSKAGGFRQVWNDVKCEPPERCYVTVAFWWGFLPLIWRSVRRTLLKCSLPWSELASTIW